jgi:hypothetical protein
MAQVGAGLGLARVRPQQKRDALPRLRRVAVQQQEGEQRARARRLQRRQRRAGNTHIERAEQTYTQSVPISRPVHSLLDVWCPRRGVGRARDDGRTAARGRHREFELHDRHAAAVAASVALGWTAVAALQPSICSSVRSMKAVPPSWPWQRPGRNWILRRFESAHVTLRRLRPATCSASRLRLERRRMRRSRATHPGLAPQVPGSAPSSPTQLPPPGYTPQRAIAAGPATAHPPIRTPSRDG